MSRRGLCINARGAVPSRSDLLDMGFQPGAYLRTPIQGSLTMLEPLRNLLIPGMKLIVDLNNECQEVRSDWSGLENACQILATRYAAFVDIVSLGNELDIWHLQPPVGAPDRNLTPAFAASLVNRGSAILRAGGIKVSASSVASNDWANYLEAMMQRCRGNADYANLHPYVSSAGGVRPDWQTVQDKWAMAYQRSGWVPTICSEAGIKVGDAGGLDPQARWITGFMAWAEQGFDHECPAATLFAWRDDIGTSEEQGDQAFGLVGSDGTKKPAYRAFQQAMGGPISEDQPVSADSRFQMGFLAWAKADPALLGTPKENESGGLPGVSFQETDKVFLTAAHIANPSDPTRPPVWTYVAFEKRTRRRYAFLGGKSVRIA